MTSYGNVLNVPPTVNTAVIGDGTKFTNIVYSDVGTPSTLVSLDANGNTMINAIHEAYTTTATAGTTTTLTVSSTGQQFFTGSGVQDVVLPLTSTMVNGMGFTIVNLSSESITIQSSGTDEVQVMAPQSTAKVTVIDTTVTTAAGWNVNYSSLVTNTTSTTGPITVTPYIALITDQIILIDTATIASPSQVVLPGFPPTGGQTWTVKDWSGMAGTYPITITIGGGLNMDGSNTYILNQNYQCLTAVWDGPTVTYSITSSYVDPSVLITAPPSSNTATTGFGSLAIGTARQNTLGYDILVNVSVVATVATGATITLGVGSTSTPTTNAVTASFSVGLTQSFCAIVPAGYYCLVNTSGTITVGSITTQVCPL